MDEFEQLLSKLTPEDLDVLFNSGVMDERIAMLPKHQDHQTAVGGALGGLADVAGAIAGNMMLDKKAKARALLAQKMGGGQQAGMPMATASSPYGVPQQRPLGLTEALAQGQSFTPFGF